MLYERSAARGMRLAQLVYLPTGRQVDKHFALMGGFFENRNSAPCECAKMP
jgi:hypothetical protein